MIKNLLSGTIETQSTFKSDDEKNSRSVMHPSDITNGIIEQRHLNGIYAVQMGLAADKPSGTSHIKMYFATDENKLYIYNGTAWKSTTLS
jgi:hypothetical protein